MALRHSTFDKAFGTGLAELEYPTLKVTFELQSQLFRTSQRALEKELQAVATAITLLAASPSSPAVLEASLASLLTRLTLLKAKVCL
jgi:hypothetical protein